MLPLLSTPPCLILIPMMPKPKPKPKLSRADADERWDARKNPAAVSVPGRADAVDRWDAHKLKPALSTSASSSSSSNSPTSSRASSSSSQKWNSNKKQRAIRRAASDERWDAWKQPPPQARELDLDDDRSRTGSNDMELDTPQPPRKQASFYAGPDFIVSPEPSMLPIPSFVVRAA